MRGGSVMAHYLDDPDATAQVLSADGWLRTGDLGVIDERGNLPPGIHRATWDEIVERYATNERREQLVNGLRAAIESLRTAGCSRVYLDGSFVTDKELPGDFDACWEADGVDADLLDPVLLDCAIAGVRRRRIMAASCSWLTGPPSLAVGGSASFSSATG